MGTRGADPFITLGLPRTASKHDVKQAFRRLALQCHPDVDPSPLAAQRFSDVKRAADVLLKQVSLLLVFIVCCRSSPDSVHTGEVELRCLYASPGMCSMGQAPTQTRSTPAERGTPTLERQMCLTTGGFCAAAIRLSLSVRLLWWPALQSWEVLWPVTIR